ncbi:hypothetical protein [Micromonospora rubida]
MTYADRIPLTRPAALRTAVAAGVFAPDARTCGHTPAQHRHLDGIEADSPAQDRVREVTAELNQARETAEYRYGLLATACAERDTALAGRTEALGTITAAWAALNAAGLQSPTASVADLIGQLADERDERLTLAESSRLAKRYDQAAEDRDYAYRLLDQTTAALNVALHHANDNTSYAPATAHYKQRAAELDGCYIALQAAAEATSTPPPGSAPGRAQGGLTRCCTHPGCPRTYRADVGPQDRGWIRLRGLTVLCPDHATPAYPASNPANTREG